MGRLLAGLGGAFGLAALWRFLRRAPEPQTTGVDPAEELRVRLEQAREAADDRDEFDAAEGQPVDEVEAPRSIEERRRAIHDKAQQALGEMHGSERRRARKPSLSRLLRGRGILQGDEKAAAGRRAAARRRGVRPSASRGGVRSLRRSRARARVGRVRAARRAARRSAPSGPRPHASRTRTGRPREGLRTPASRRPLTGWPPCRRRSRAIPAVPRLVVEGAFLLLVAVLAGLADLSAAWIVLVMAVAWGLVVLTEWAAAAKRSRWRLEEIAPPADAGSKPAADTTGPWDMPVVEATVVESGPDPESKTIVAKLPVEPEIAERRSRGKAGAEAPAGPPPPQARRDQRCRSCRRSLGGVASRLPSQPPSWSPCPAPPRSARRRR